MRLINTRTGLFEEFIGRNIPKYAILSHTWEEEEVSFKDMSDPSCIDKKGYRKIEMTCRIASEADLNYIWIDTCNIDKSSSAELTEAINSMYRWYQRAEACYAFLSDLPASSSLNTALPKCRWFTRGWTLQELIAPRTVYFYDQEWNYRGSKRDWFEDLSRITGIDAGILRHEQSLSAVMVAQKMSWAAHRETTRVEDIAYCLFGIFDVNMPLLYGEEEKAFKRLQEEILRLTNDFSIFAWRMPSTVANKIGPQGRTFCGVLAETPLAFAGCSALTKVPSHGQREFLISNTTIKTNTQIIQEPIPGAHGCRYVLPLNCSSAPKQLLGIRVKKYGFNHFIREDPWNFVEFTDRFYSEAPAELYLLNKLPNTNLNHGSLCLDMSLFVAQSRTHVLQIKFPPGIRYYNVFPKGRFDFEDQLYFVSGDSTRDTGILRFIYKPFLQGYGYKTEVEFDCIFFSMGWSALELSCLQCTLVDYQLFATSLNELQSHFGTWDHNTSRIVTYLVNRKIPKSSSAAFRIPGTKDVASVSFRLSLVSDSSICPNKFWKVDFSHEICETNNLPQT